MTNHVINIWFDRVVASTHFVTERERERERNHSSRMDSYGVRNLLWIVFRDNLDCIFCSTPCVNEQEKLLHIFHNHNRFWDIGISKYTSIIKKLWRACFTRSNNVYTCDYCKATFHIGDIRVLHTHMKSSHPIVMLSYTILYNKLC